MSVYENDMKFIDACYNFPLLFKSVDVVDGSLCVKGAEIWVESVGHNLGDLVGVCNVGCVGHVSLKSTHVQTHVQTHLKSDTFAVPIDLAPRWVIKFCQIRFT